MMGDDLNDSPESGAIPAHPAEQHATYRAACAALMRQRDAAISTAAVRAMQDAARMFDATHCRAVTAPDMTLAREPVAWMDSGETGGTGRQRFRVISAATKAGMSPTISRVYSTPLYPPAEHAQLTDSQVGAACLAYRHDYGLLLPHAKVRIAAECRQWDEALRKARHPLADAFAGAMAALDAPAAPLLRDLGDAVLRAGGADSEGVEP